MKVSKSIRIDNEAWHIAKVEATKRGPPLGEFIEAMIRWCAEPHTITCDREHDFEFNPLDYIPLRCIEVPGEVKQ